ncbi:MAG: hypothetical protein H7Y88_07230 [Phycisphaerales bacterium]|nr:hypothetical protein [Phycisphaerales bacterium]
MWLFEILCTARRTATLGFMEGSYELKVTRSGDVLRIKAREGFSNGSREHWAGDVAVLQLLDAMSAAYQSVAMDAARYGYVGPAIQLLERERDCLSTVATHLRNAETSRKESAKYS